MLFSSRHGSLLGRKYQLPVGRSATNGLPEDCLSLFYILPVLSVLAHGARYEERDSNSTAAASTFVYQNSGTDNDFIFALNAAENGDLFFHLSAPSSSSWVAVGIGSQMKDALIFIAYPNATGDGIYLDRSPFSITPD